MDVHRREKSSDTLPSVAPFGPAASGDGKKHNRHVYVVIFLVAAATIRLAFSGVGPAVTAAPHRHDWDRKLWPNSDFDWYTLEPSTEIKWTPCYDGHQCSRLLLPLDYTNPDDNRTTAIALRLVPAATTPRRGTILINPGGPGGSGTDLAGRAGANISQIVNSFDVLGFDPRGTGASTPRADCFTTASQRKIFDAQRGAWAVNRTDSTTGVAMARQEIVGARCEANIGGEDGIARYMSTASVSRDMIEISSRVGEEKLNYWGFSYGSVLGQYFAAMYPDKVGRVIIDGVFDAESYRSEHWSTNLLDMEAVMDSLFDYCYQAGPLKCSLYEPTPEAIKTRYERVLDAVEREPVPIALADPPYVVTRDSLVAMLFGAAYKPLAFFVHVIDVVRAIEERNATALAALAKWIDVDQTKCECSARALPWVADNEAFFGIACGDAAEYSFEEDDYARAYNRLVGDSPRAGPIWAVHYLQCAAWKVRPAWRYEGSLAAPNGTANPLLIVQPRFDPVCPLRDAKVVRARYPGAGMVVQNSHGHCSLSAPSICTARHIRAYFEKGVVPPEGTVCEVDELPFVGQVRGMHGLSEEDAKLLEALQGLDAVVPMLGFT